MSMKKEKVLLVRITNEQFRILDEKTNSAGFIKKSDYVRFILFNYKSSDELISKIYDEVMKH